MVKLDSAHQSEQKIGDLNLQRKIYIKWCFSIEIEGLQGI